jgi:hypothetical protein
MLLTLAAFALGGCTTDELLSQPANRSPFSPDGAGWLSPA